MRASGHRDGQNDGFILIAVLGVLALLSSLFIVLSLVAGSTVGSAALARSDLVADALMQAGVELAGYQLFVVKAPAGDIDGQQIRLNGGVISLSVMPESGKVDLNRSDRVLLAAAYSAAGLAGMRPEAFADRVIDWRDADETPGEQGAESETYRAEGLRYGPGNRPFHDVDEIGWLPGMNRAGVTALRPFLTVHNPAGRLDLASISPALLHALPGVDPRKVEAALASRGTKPPEEIPQIQAMLSENSAFFASDPPAAFRVRIEVRANGASRANRVEAILIAPASRQKAYQITQWRVIGE